MLSDILHVTFMQSVFQTMTGFLSKFRVFASVEVLVLPLALDFHCMKSLVQAKVWEMCFGWKHCPPVCLKPNCQPSSVQVRCMLNIWGVMLFIRMTWIVGQAGVGRFEYFWQFMWIRALIHTTSTASHHPTAIHHPGAKCYCKVPPAVNCQARAHFPVPLQLLTQASEGVNSWMRQKHYISLKDCKQLVLHAESILQEVQEWN